MKALALLTLLLITKATITFACGYYPYGEDVRYNFFKPSMVMPNEVNWFHYSSSEFFYKDYDFEVNSKEQYAENLNDWASYFDNKYATADIYEALIHATTYDFNNSKSTNLFIRGLHDSKATSEIAYFIFAKSCNGFNGKGSDPWERTPKSFQKKRAKMIKKALGFATSSTNQMLKKRYAYLAIRMAFYQENYKQVQQIFDAFFTKIDPATPADFWALHFYIQTLEDNAERSILAAQVFLHSSEKRFAVHDFFNRDYDFAFLLSQAKSNDQRIALHYTAASLSLNQAYDHIEAIVALDPSHDCLDFLVLREINKLEDWIFTPFYTNFDPSTSVYNEEMETKVLDERVKEDRLYAKRLTTLIAQIAKKKESSHVWWKLFEQYGHILSRDFDEVTIRLSEIQNNPDATAEQRSLAADLMALTMVSNAEKLDLTHPLLQKTLMNAASQNNNQLLLAVARELELHGRKVLAAAVLSHVNENDTYNPWKSHELHNTLGSDYYYDYFFFLDAVYSISEIEAIIDATLKFQTKEHDAFGNWCYARLGKDIPHFYEMLGTKQIRANNWSQALSAFKNVPDTVWQEERFKSHMNEDPFSNDFYPSYDAKHNEEIKNSYTKPQLVKEIIRLQEELDKTAGNEKAKIAYRLGNCFRNMTYYGNAWLMRRYAWSGYAQLSGLEDDEEYFHANWAKKYYLIAFKSSTEKKFKALSLRMAGKCEQYHLLFEMDANFHSDEEEIAAFKLNTLYKQLRQEFPNDYSKIVSTCDYLPDYYASVD